MLEGLIKGEPLYPRGLITGIEKVPRNKLYYIQCLSNTVIRFEFTGVLSYKIVSGGSLLPGETYDRIYFVVNR